MSWVAFVLVLSAVVGRLRGGRWSNLSDVQTRAWGLLVVGLALQAAAQFLPADQRSLAVAMVLASYLPILAMVWINRKAAGMWIAGIGILMNFTVIALNRGMPVLTASVEVAGGDPDPVLGGKHVLMDASTHLPFLGDLIPLPGAVVSLGDVFLAIGLGVFIEEQIRKPPRLFRRGVRGSSGSALD